MYMVSSSSTTGTKGANTDTLKDFAQRIEAADLKTPRIIGFGISDKKTFANACKYSSGGIIGTAFIKAISEKGSLKENIEGFVKGIR